jgi:hypothetical protein
MTVIYPPRPVYRLYEAAVPSNPIPAPHASGPDISLPFYGYEETYRREDVAFPSPMYELVHLNDFERGRTPAPIPNPGPGYRVLTVG